jgi:hypothetical protein
LSGVVWFSLCKFLIYSCEEDKKELESGSSHYEVVQRMKAGLVAMSELYYSQRHQKIHHGLDPIVGQNFWAAFLAYFDRLSSDNYLCCVFPNECTDGHPVGSSDEAIALRMREELGEIVWGDFRIRIPGSTQILDILEFFFRYVAQPMDQWYHDYCKSYHPRSYDIPRGRYNYTVNVNSMLKRFNHPYKLQKGVIVRVDSEVLDSRITSVEFRTDDDHLLTLLNSAVDNFLDRSGTKKLEGLRSIVDAFERLKTLEDTDKKKSVAQVIEKLSPFDEICLHYDDHLRKLTDFANKYTVRHHEVDKIVLDDETLIDYLFYSYFNLVRLILEKYNLVE